MNQTLYRITDPAGWPKDAAWLVLRYDKADVEDSGGEVHTVTVGIEAEILDLTGHRLEKLRPIPSMLARNTMVPIGSFETRSQMIDLMTPILIRMAQDIILAFRPRPSLPQLDAIKKEFLQDPWKTACWVLNTIPPELEYWIRTRPAAHRGIPPR